MTSITAMLAGIACGEPSRAGADPVVGSVA